MRSFSTFRKFHTMINVLGEALLTSNTNEAPTAETVLRENAGRAYETRIINNLISAFDSISPSGWKRIDHDAYNSLRGAKFSTTSKHWKTHVGSSGVKRLIYIHGSTRPSDPDAIISVYDTETKKLHILGIECKSVKTNAKGDKITQGAPSSTLVYNYDYDGQAFVISPKLSGVINANSAADWTIRMMLRAIEKPIRAMVEEIDKGTHLKGDLAKYKKTDQDGLRLGGTKGLPLACLKHTWTHLSKKMKLLKGTNISSKDFWKKTGAADHKSLGDFGGFDSNVMNCRLYANKKPPSYYIQVGAGSKGGFYSLGGGDLSATCSSWNDPLKLGSIVHYLTSETKLEVRIKAPGSCPGMEAMKDGFPYNLDVVEKTQSTGSKSRLKKGDKIDANWKVADGDDAVMDVVDVTRDPADPGNTEIVQACPRVRIQNGKGCELIVFTRVVPTNSGKLNLENGTDCTTVLKAIIANYKSIWVSPYGGK